MNRVSRQHEHDKEDLVLIMLSWAQHTVVSLINLSYMNAPFSQQHGASLHCCCIIRDIVGPLMWIDYAQVKTVASKHCARRECAAASSSLEPVTSLRAGLGSAVRH